MRKLLPLFLLSVCCSASAEWILIACANTCKRAMLEYDPARVVRQGDVIEIWMKVSGELYKETMRQKFTDNPGVFSAAEVNDFQDNYSHSLSRFAINCQKYQVSVIATQFYRGNGTPLGSPGSSQPFSDIFPGTLIDIAASKLCRKNNESK
jgi:hypothetical protein